MMEKHKEWLVKYVVGDVDEEGDVKPKNYVEHCLILAPHNETMIWAGFLSSNILCGKNVWAEAFMKVAQFVGQWGIWKMGGRHWNMVKIMMAIGLENFSSSRYDLHFPNWSNISLTIITCSAQ